jgi:hypothetical protein
MSAQKIDGKAVSRAIGEYSIYDYMVASTIKLSSF